MYPLYVGLDAGLQDFVHHLYGSLMPYMYALYVCIICTGNACVQVKEGGDMSMGVGIMRRVAVRQSQDGR